MALWSHRKFAVLARVSRQAIGRAVREGRIVTGAGGIDPSHLTNRDYLALHGPAATIRLPDRRTDVPRVGAPSTDLEARCRQARAKLELARQRLGETRDDYHDRAEAIRVVTADARGFVNEFKKLSTNYRTLLAKRLGMPADVAGAILEKLVAALLEELGDLEGEATRLIETA